MLPALLLLSLASAPEPVRLTAETLQWDTRHERGSAEGHATLESRNATLKARVIAYDQPAGLAIATGEVVGRFQGDGGHFVLHAESLGVRIENGEVVEVFALEGELDRLHGERAEARVKAEHLKREGTAWRVDGAVLVPCACSVDEPVITVSASQATLDFEAQRASLWFPTVKVHGVPVLWSPWLSLPLSNRQTGLLFPKPGFTALNGVSFEQPVFITLGESFDLTLTPGYFGGVEQPFGIRGPRLGTELRYAPSERTHGRVTFGLLYDLKPPRDPVTTAPALTGMRGPRFEAAWQHSQDFEGGVRARVDASLVSDGFLFRDLTTDVLAREAGYLRSTAVLAHVSDTAWLGADAVVRQDLGWGFPLLPTGAITPTTLGGPRTLQRLPGFAAFLPEKVLVGPLSVSASAEWVRLAPLLGGTGDEGVFANEGRAFSPDGTPLSVDCLRERLYWPNGVSAACPAEVRPGATVERGDGRWQAGEREARHRLMVLPRVSVSGALLDTLQAQAFAGWRQGVWLGEVTGRATARGYPLLGARVETEIGRDFGGLKHVIAPALDVRAVPFSVGDAPAPYDELDTAVPPSGRALQASASVRQRLIRPSGELAMLEVGQGFELTPGLTSVAETYARLRVRLGWVSFDGIGRLDPNQGRVTRASARLGVDDGRGDGAYGTYERLVTEGSALQRQPVDLLFGWPTPGLVQGASQLVSAGARAALGPVRLRYDVLFSDRTFGAAGTTNAPALTLTQHSLGVSWAPACDCLTVDLSATQRIDDGQRLVPTYRLVPDLFASVTIGSFGSLGIAR